MFEKYSPEQIDYKELAEFFLTLLEIKENLNKGRAGFTDEENKCG